MVTHNVAIAQMADRAVSLRDGQIAGETRNARRLTPAEIAW